MLKLKLNREPEWLDLVAGVRVLVKPARTTLLAPASTAQALRNLPDDADRDLRYAVYCAEVAKLVILEWVGDADGNPVEPDEAWISALMDMPTITKAFSDLYVGPALLLQAEKKGSAPLPSGITAGARARNIAASARPAARNAPTS